MLEILLFEAAGDIPTQLADVEAALLAEAGVELEGQLGADYRPGRWRDPSTGASAVIDLGRAPIEDDPIHPPTAYDGWRPMQLGIQIPVTGPHWQCVEALCLVERLLARLPQASALDTEDAGHDDETPGPRPWNRPRVLASWERLHTAYNQGRTTLRRMARLSSVCLWRYRRERALGLTRHPKLHWPEALVLVDSATGNVHSACFWDDASADLALPPVDLLIVRRGAAAGVLDSSALQQAGTPMALDCAGAAVVAMNDATRRLHAQAELLPAARFLALDDADWTD